MDAPAVKVKSDIDFMEESCRITAEAIRLTARYAAPGVTTQELDVIADDFIRSSGGVPAFKGYVVDGKKFPAAICTSIDEEVVHGIPGERKLVEGEILSIDAGVYKNGFYGDSAFSVAIGKVSEEKEKLLRITQESLHEGIAVVRDGAMVYDIGRAVQEYVEEHGFSVVRELCGHGVGQKLHQEPSIPNFVPNFREKKFFRNVPLREGQTIAIEPMVNAGTHKVYVKRDGWTVVTADHAPSAHFEHTVLVTKSGAVILTQ
ncbi:MAG TPA: type I methionyl aminopeptidase [Candidatus Kapabacteria bacterium]|nr:type I methionyl aminopeptidase [Candidatus Kapabacteria bacterium]